MQISSLTPQFTAANKNQNMNNRIKMDSQPAFGMKYQISTKQAKTFYSSLEDKSYFRERVSELRHGVKVISPRLDDMLKSNLYAKLEVLKAEPHFNEAWQKVIGESACDDLSINQLTELFIPEYKKKHLNLHCENYCRTSSEDLKPDPKGNLIKIFAGKYDITSSSYDSVSTSVIWEHIMNFHNLALKGIIKDSKMLQKLEKTIEKLDKTKNY